MVDSKLVELQAAIHRFLAAAEQAIIQHRLFVSYNDLIVGIAGELRQMLPLYERTRWLFREARETSASFL
jgi:hypothetical protein